MKSLRPEYRSEYERWRKIVGEHEPYAGDRMIGIHDVLRAHFLIANYFHSQSDSIGLVGPRDQDASLLHSAVGRQLISFGGKDKWTHETELLATLFFGLIKNHPFHDGNKRTALLTLLYHMSKCRLVPTIGQSELERLTLSVAANSLSRYSRYEDFVRKEKQDADVLFLAHFLKRNSRREDRKTYTITYNDLHTLLKHKGYWLDNVVDNHVDVMTFRETWEFNPLPRKLKKPIKLTQVGFPGWTKQVGKGAIKTIREATELTAENGVDSQAFFHELDDLQTLIQIYDAPLRRLKDK